MMATLSRLFSCLNHKSLRSAAIPLPPQRPKFFCNGGGVCEWSHPPTGFKTGRTNAEQSKGCSERKERERRPEVVRGRDQTVEGIRRLEKEKPGVFLFFVFLFLPTQREEEEKSDSNKSNISMR